jgi:aspartyl-tRNA(Asn)/glutamyl-tRNA(Gln) amidotransferase subunit B
MLETGKAPEEIVKEQGITQISDEEELERLIGEVIMENPDSVDDYRGGKEKALGFLVGQVMRKTQGRANPQLVNEMLRRSLEG